MASGLRWRKLLQPGKELKSIKASSHRQTTAMAFTVLGNLRKSEPGVTWLFQNLVSGMATKQVRRLERLLAVFSLEILMVGVLGFRNTLIGAFSPGPFLKAQARPSLASEVRLNGQFPHPS